jgi:hypothetical protein
MADRGRARLGVIDVAATPRIVVDEWLVQEDVDELTRAVQAPLGRWDVMFATSWKYAWAAGTVYDKRGIRVHVVAPGVLDFRRYALGVDRLQVKRVRAVVAGHGVSRSVRLVDARECEHVVARRWEPSAVLDPVYDAFDVACDASWAVEMATTLASALCVDLDVDEVLS